MKRILVCFLLVASVACADPGVQVDRNFGFLQVATPTFSIGTSTATNIGALLPAGCKGFELNVFGGDVIVGNSTNISTGPLYIGHKIASGTSMTFSGVADAILGAFNMVGKATGASPATGTLVAW